MDVEETGGGKGKAKSQNCQREIRSDVSGQNSSLYIWNRSFWL